MILCSGENRRGLPCQRRVEEAGDFCYAHPGHGHDDTVDLSAAPPVDDVDAVNRWLRSMAIDALHKHAAATGGAVKPQTFDYFRRAISALTEEHSERHPPRRVDDPVSRMRAALDAIDFG